MRISKRLADITFAYDSAEKLREHDVDEHHLCVKCEKYFANKNNFEMHQQKHQPRTMECCGRYKTFKSFSGVLIHLGSGGCSSNITEDDLDDLARECYQSRKYINDELEDGGWLYTCPHCVTEFSKLSALYQHAEDVPSCSYLAKDHGCLVKLKRFISRKMEFNEVFGFLEIEWVDLVNPDVDVISASSKVPRPDVSRASGVWIRVGASMGYRGCFLYRS
ncbi:hypothetical protein ABHI18_007350 [Aspergillus niger]